jgi:outer membrane protein, heavy metal efflux system
MSVCRSARFARPISGKREKNALIAPRRRALAVAIAMAVASALLSEPTTVHGQQRPVLTLDQAIDLALTHNHALKAARTQIQQNQAQEITAGIRPNPVLSGDSQFLPFFNPENFTTENLDQLSQFDVGLGYLWERGGKRKRRMEAARDQTAVTAFQVADTERATIFNVAQQFVGGLLAKANVELATQNLQSFKQTVDIAEYQYKVGQISEGDALKIRLQLLQFQSDLSAAQLAQVQAMSSLRQLIGYDAVASNFDLEGSLTYEPLSLGLEDLQVKALNQRPDLLAAKQGVVASRSQHTLALANGKRDLNTSFNYSHVAGESSASLFFNMELPIFDRNQGEKARTQFAITQAEESANFASDTVMTDIRNAYEALKSNEQIVKLYQSGYLKSAQDSREISEYAYKKGAASLLDFLDAERSFRTTQLAYRQSLAAYMLALEQLKQAIGVRRLP